MQAKAKMRVRKAVDRSVLQDDSYKLFRAAMFGRMIQLAANGIIDSGEGKRNSIMQYDEYHYLFFIVPKPSNSSRIYL
jgi:hypothetical protein